MKIYKCNICGNIMMVLKDSGVNPVCCNEEMQLLQCKNEEELNEKHLPVITRVNGIVIVEVNHVYTDDHYIDFIILHTTKGIYLKYIGPGKKPLASFRVDYDEKVIKAYEYCNIHGLFAKGWDNEEENDC